MKLLMRVETQSGQFQLTGWIIFFYSLDFWDEKGKEQN